MLSCLTLVYICKIVIQELSLNENEIDSSHEKIILLHKRLITFYHVGTILKSS